MNTSATITSSVEQGMRAGRNMVAAVGHIAPSWPLDRWVAVNPWWPLRASRFQNVALDLQERCGIRPLMDTEYYRRRFEDGAISEQSLRRALADERETGDGEQALNDLKRDEAVNEPIVPLWSRLLDQALAPDPMAQVVYGIRDQISRFCGGYFDSHQALIQSKRPACMLRAWLDQMRHGRDLEQVLRSRRARPFLEAFPDQPDELIALGCQWLEVRVDRAQAIGHALLLDINGWASYCAWLAWEAHLVGERDDNLKALLAIRFAWEVLVWASRTRTDWHEPADQAWKRLESTRQVREKQAHRIWRWQRALEWSYQSDMIARLNEPTELPAPDIPELQAVFCIDVRSEVIRRHLEAQSDGIQTLGFAGFFGLPMDYQSLDASAPSPQLPGLLSPVYRVQQTSGSQRRDWSLRALRQGKLERSRSFSHLKRSTLTMFPFVEGFGALSAWGLLRDTLGIGNRRGDECATQPGELRHAYGGDPLQPGEKVALAASILRGLSLCEPWAPLILLVGHASRVDNNPHQASLACGACGGQNGGVNAEVAASLLNDREVRAGLQEQGFSLPGHVWFVSAEHNTVTDEISLLDEQNVPESHWRRLESLRDWLEKAAAGCRRERSAALGVGKLSDVALKKALARRTADWSEVRPEWGLANNAALVIAPRHRTRHVDLEGRVFLHEYRPDLDSDGSVLEALMTAPMIVANWINLQYYASVTAPEVYGAGNKLLHSVVGGNIGVLEGNAGDLRIGLPWQSVHDGTKWVHEPLRLSVFIDAPTDRIDGVLDRHPDVRDLVNGEWLFLFSIEDGGRIRHYHQGGWRDVVVE
ncbi:DUF2309 domain-containing protein [Tamilnaduibacter salinus]|uniref:Probable inorganic carbon transporter subunit DabA n=1 Tax=Tamilnaduibacter salinus TaxID=1484056 RepID=A0A2A2I247_9GAMM|nr:DUF2309 domain-containing protein [Tamilnaduibacter salinus]PAV25386.1 DUF2309 domain-containing protein [Tamilnaduibacter salinus]